MSSKVNTILIATSITLSVVSITVMVGLLIGLYPMISTTVVNNKNDLKDLIKPIYTKCLTVNSDGIANANAIMNNLFASDFKSINAAETKLRDAMIGSVGFFWQLVPNLKWEIQEMLQVGNRVIVRSLASGNPVGNFMGVTCNGSKAFSIMTIDIHTVENGKIQEIYHLEEWTTAIQELSK